MPWLARRWVYEYLIFNAYSYIYSKLMTCEFRSNSQPVCLLGMYGGMPSYGTCIRCVERGENNPEHADKIQTAPPLSKQAATLGVALTGWAASGFSSTPPEILAQREATCRACSEWDSAAWNNTGRCMKCGCSTWAKLRMSSEQCPLGKWQATSDQKSTPEQDTTN